MSLLKLSPMSKGAEFQGAEESRKGAFEFKCSLSKSCFEIPKNSILQSKALLEFSLHFIQNDTQNAKRNAKTYFKQLENK